MKNLILVLICVPIAVYAQGPTTGDSQHSEDMLAARAWYAGCQDLKDPRIVSRMVDWFKAHPDDAENLFYLSLAVNKKGSSFAGPTDRKMLKKRQTMDLRPRKPYSGQFRRWAMECPRIGRRVIECCKRR